jgi:hypothetical protein
MWQRQRQQERGNDADDADEGDDDLDLADSADLEDLYDEAVAEAVAAGGFQCKVFRLLVCMFLLANVSHSVAAWAGWTPLTSNVHPTLF